jgi:hypothetical protein
LSDFIVCSIFENRVRYAGMLALGASTGIVAALVNGRWPYGGVAARFSRRMVAAA